ncbi:MAG: energy-coupling factor ABC transporter ATP-binding protein [Acidaminococcaceae bacterium]|nr:energy-coupling factor ABC transporter ATP-binding protein [Acidaminococcaceae bacterium]MBQ5346426.1 energy-coupling factor ABC transporter ATP-binding protein [Acidaminococcaceae bacterium]
MGEIAIKNVTFTYPQQHSPTLQNVNLFIPAGEMVLIAGESGCGKSTLLKLLNGIIPFSSEGEFLGNVFIDGKNTRDADIKTLSMQVGMVFQNPDDQMFSENVYDEVAFALENQGVPPSEIEQEVMRYLELVGLESFKDRSIDSLSGGQKQKAALASVLIGKPSVLVLDEPVSQVDPASTKELLQLLQKIWRKTRTTILIVEHRLNEVMNYVQRLILMASGGKVLFDGSIGSVFKKPDVFLQAGLRIPQGLELLAKLNIETAADRLPSPAEVADLIRSSDRRFCRKKEDNGKDREENATFCHIDNLSFLYNKKEDFSLQIKELKLKKNQFVCLVGHNGSGKSTFLKLLCGLLQGQGKIQFAAPPQISVVLQNPDMMLYHYTVFEEITCEALNVSKTYDKDYYSRLLEKLSLALWEQSFPLSLSRGQRFRTAIACALLAKPDLLILDEPTTGQDIRNVEAILQLIKDQQGQGLTVLFCTHDIETAFRYADQILFFEGGKILYQGSPSEIIQSKQISESYCPDISNIAMRLYEAPAVSIEEVLQDEVK